MAVCTGPLMLIATVSVSLTRGVADAQEVNTIFQVIALFQAYNAVNVPGGPIYNKRHE